MPWLTWHAPSGERRLAALGSALALQTADKFKVNLHHDYAVHGFRTAWSLLAVVDADELRSLRDEEILAVGLS
jgi:hypothetical protein